MRSRHSPSRSPRAERGITYLGVLFFVVAIGIGLAAVATVWHTASKREKEVQLLFVGEQFENALTDYALSSPGGAQYPRSLDDLVEDKRFPSIRRHQRRIYVDPMTGKAEWGLVKLADDSIAGIYSLSKDVPLKQANFPATKQEFEKAKTYADWKFVPQPASGAPPVPGAGTGVTPNAGDANGLPTVPGPTAAPIGGPGMSTSPQGNNPFPPAIPPSTPNAAERR